MTTTDQRRQELVQDGMLSIPEVMELTKMSRSDIYERMTRGELAYAKLGRRRVIPRKAVIEMLSKSLVAAG